MTGSAAGPSTTGDLRARHWSAAAKDRRGHGLGVPADPQRGRDHRPIVRVLRRALVDTVPLIDELIVMDGVLHRRHRPDRRRRGREGLTGARGCSRGGPGAGKGEGPGRASRACSGYARSGARHRHRQHPPALRDRAAGPPADRAGDRPTSRASTTGRWPSAPASCPDRRRAGHRAARPPAAQRVLARAGRAGAAAVGRVRRAPRAAGADPVLLRVRRGAGPAGRHPARGGATPSPRSTSSAGSTATRT